MKPEPTQKENPHNLSLRQHIFASRSISRFCNEEGFVDLQMFQPKKRRFAGPADKIFCARRAWDERAEKGYGKHIEDKFQTVVDRFLQGNSPMFSEENLAITEFYGLWNVRHVWSKVPMEDTPIKGVKELSVSLTLDDQERLEKEQISYLTDELAIPSRQMRGISIQMNIDNVVEKMAGTKWGILHASEGEFIVPDNFLARRIIPINPSVCFVADHESGTLNRNDVGLINALAIKSAEKYFFARDLNNCLTYKKLL